MNVGVAASQDGSITVANVQEDQDDDGDDEWEDEDEELSNAQAIELNFDINSVVNGQVPNNQNNMIQNV